MTPEVSSSGGGTTEDDTESSESPRSGSKASKRSSGAKNSSKKSSKHKSQLKDKKSSSKEIVEAQTTPSSSPAASSSVIALKAREPKLKKSSKHKKQKSSSALSVSDKKEDKKKKKKKNKKSKKSVDSSEASASSMSSNATSSTKSSASALASQSPGSSLKIVTPKPSRASAPLPIQVRTSSSSGFGSLTSLGPSSLPMGPAGLPMSAAGSSSAPTSTSPHLDSPDHIKTKPELPPKPNLNLQEILTEFMSPIDGLLRTMLAFFEDHITPFVLLHLRDREFVENYVVPRYQKFVYLKNHVDAETSQQHIHPDIFIELAWQSHMCRPMQYRHYSQRYYGGRILQHDLTQLRLAHDIEKSDLEIMQKHWKKLYHGESFSKTMPTNKLLKQIVVGAGSAFSSSSSSSHGPSHIPAPKLAQMSQSSSSSHTGSMSSSSSSASKLPVKNKSKSKIDSSASTNTSSTSVPNKAGVSGSSVTIGEPTVKWHWKKETATVSTSAAASGDATGLFSDSISAAASRLSSLIGSGPGGSSGSGGASSASSASTPLPPLDFDLASAIMEDAEVAAKWSRSLRKASSGEWSVKNWETDRAMHLLLKSYEMYFYLVLKYGSKYSMSYFCVPPYIEMVARAHMIHPQLYIGDCRKYRGHLVGPSSALRYSAPPAPSSDPAPSASSSTKPTPTFNATDYEKARKQLAMALDIPKAKVPKNPAELCSFVSIREFGGPIENVVKPCAVLPLEILVRIFKRLPSRFNSHMSVCTQWATAAMLPDVWASHVARDFPKSIPEMPSHTPETIRFFYLELVHRELGDPVIFDIGAAKVRCGSSTDYLIATNRHSGSGESSMADDSSTSSVEGDTTDTTATSPGVINNNKNNDSHPPAVAASSSSPSQARRQSRPNLGLSSEDLSVFSGGGGFFINAHSDIAPRFIYQSAVRRVISKRK